MKWTEYFMDHRELNVSRILTCGWKLQYNVPRHAAIATC